MTWGSIRDHASPYTHTYTYICIYIYIHMTSVELTVAVQRFPGLRTPKLLKQFLVLASSESQLLISSTCKMPAWPMANNAAYGCTRTNARKGEH